MFYYGQYKDGLMQNSKGVRTLLLNYEAGAIERGMVFIAFSLADLDELCGWRYFICEPISPKCFSSIYELINIRYQVNDC